jgi:hypothetical protein
VLAKAIATARARGTRVRLEKDANMEQWLTAIENTSFGIWVRESGSIWSYPMIITVHSYGMAMLAGLSAVIDLRLLGFASGVPVPSMTKLLPLIRVGFVLSLISGIALTIGDAGSMLISPIFYIKMGFVALALATGVVIKRRVFDRPELGAAVPPAHAKALAVWSLIFWVASITAGRLTAYLGPAVALKGITH